MSELSIRYSEIFLSIQGEGRFAGVPSVFLRTFGCNFKCHGFSQPRQRERWLSEADMPYMQQDLTHIRTLEQLPVVSVGCDSSASWSARYRQFAAHEDVPCIARRLIAATPEGNWAGSTGNDVHLVITGGEPLLGWQRALGALLRSPALDSLANVTFETNGTQRLRPELCEALTARASLHVTWSVSTKLSISGEAWNDAVVPDALTSYRAVPNSYLYLKFVVEDEDDFAEAERALAAYKEAGVRVDAVYAMPVGALAEPYHAAQTGVAELCLRHGYRYSPRLHIDLFGNRFGT